MMKLPTQNEHSVTPVSIRPFIGLVVLTFLILLSGCRDDGLDDEATQDFLQTPDPDQFGYYLNRSPGVRDGEIRAVHNVDDFPRAYYNTIDPDNTRNTFEKWKIANGFLNNNGSEKACTTTDCCVGEQTINSQCKSVRVHVSFRDTKDLGYGRDMFMIQNTDSSQPMHDKDLAVYVENYQVDAVPDLPYGPLNLEALILKDPHWQFGVNAIEFSTYPYGPGEPTTPPEAELASRQFTKFYNFAGRSKADAGELQLQVDLDGRGLREMPTPCNVCHGGRGRTQVLGGPSDESLRLAPTVLGSLPGDLMANMQMLATDTFQFSASPGFGEADNQEGINAINSAVFDTYSRHQEFVNTDFSSPNIDTQSYWQPSFAIALYNLREVGGVFDSNRVPVGWKNNASLYRDLVSPNCIVCHALQGSVINDQINFSTDTKFQNFDNRIEHLVFERGLMPLGLLGYREFWDLKNPGQMATALGLNNKLENENVIKPGKPVARIFGPSRAGTGSVRVSGRSSDFAKSYQWTVSPEPSNLIADGPDLSFDVDASISDYDVTLKVSNSQTVASDISNSANGENTKTLSISYDINQQNSPTLYGAEGVRKVFEEKCTTCHSLAKTASGAPFSLDVCEQTNAVDRERVYREILNRINFQSPLDSLLIRKPTNGATNLSDITNTEINNENYHNGRTNIIFDNASTELDTLISWILSGAKADPNHPACVP